MVDQNHELDTYVVRPGSSVVSASALKMELEVLDEVQLHELELLEQYEAISLSTISSNSFSSIIPSSTNRSISNPNRSRNSLFVSRTRSPDSVKLGFIYITIIVNGVKFSGGSQKESSLVIYQLSVSIYQYNNMICAESIRIKRV